VKGLSGNSLEKIDDIDLRIIKLLQEDSRLSFNKVANRLGISVGTAYNRIKNLGEKDVLMGYTVRVDPIKLGFAVTAVLFVQAEGTHLVEVEEDIAKIDNVISVYDITGDFDIAVIVRFRDRTGLNAFIKNLLAMPYVKRTVTSIVLNVVKEDFRVNLSRD